MRDSAYAPPDFRASVWARSRMGLVKYLTVSVVGALVSGYWVSASAQEGRFRGGSVHITAIELVAAVRDSNGTLPLNLTPDDFIVLEDGVERQVIGVDYLTARTDSRSEPGFENPPLMEPAPVRAPQPRWTIVIYFDLFLSSSATIETAAKSLAEHADAMVDLGSVHVIVGNPTPEVVIANARDVESLRAALRKAGSRPAADWLARHRRRYQFESDLGLVPGRSPAQTPVESFLAAEVASARRFEDSVIRAIAGYPRELPRALILVSEGFEFDVAAYYRQFRAIPQDLAMAYQLGPRAQALAKALAAAGWTTFAIHGLPGFGEQWVDDAARSSAGRLQNASAGALFATLHADQPLQTVADATGGSSGTRADIPRIISSVRNRVIITYQVSRPPDGQLHRVEVRARRPGVTVRTFRWSSEATPEEIAASRAAALLSNHHALVGELPTDVQVEWSSTKGRRRTGRVTVRTSLAGVVPHLGSTPGVFRVTIAGMKANNEIFTVHRLVTGQSPGDRSLTYCAPIEAPRGQLTIAVAVEELTTGMWGGGTAR